MSGRRRDVDVYLQRTRSCRTTTSASRSGSDRDVTSRRMRAPSEPSCGFSPTVSMCGQAVDSHSVAWVRPLGQTDVVPDRCSLRPSGVRDESQECTEPQQRVSLDSGYAVVHSHLEVYSLVHRSHIMAISRRFPIPFDLAFPSGAYLVSEVSPVFDFDKSTRENKVQQVDIETGKLLWQVDVLDADPEAKRSSKTVSVKIPGTCSRSRPGTTGPPRLRRWSSRVSRCCRGSSPRRTSRRSRGPSGPPRWSRRQRGSPRSTSRTASPRPQLHRSRALRRSGVVIVAGIQSSTPAATGSVLAGDES